MNTSTRVGPPPPMPWYTNEEGMLLAILVAKRARLSGMRPFGSVIVDDVHRRTVGQAGGTETAINPVRHSELVAIKQACAERGGLLQGCTLFQTHMPCHMCVGAIKHAKIGRVIVGSTREDLPALFRSCRIHATDLLLDTSTPPEVVVGVLRTECIALFDEEIRKLVQGAPIKP